MHRLDRPTSGVVLLALSDTAAWVEALSTAEKRYVALVRGTLAATEVDRPLTNRTTGRKQEARTGFEPLGHVSLGDRFGAATLVSVRLYTGRRHQIRRHASHLRHQVLVDTTYGKGAINRYCRDELGFGRLCLHAASLSIAHPHTGAVIHIRDPWPDDLAAPLERLLPRSGWPPIL